MKYIITSERAYEHPDEYRNEYYTTRKFDVGDEFILDGITWIVEDVISDVNVFDEPTIENKKDMIRINRINTNDEEYIEIEILDMGWNTIYKGTMSLEEYARCTINGGCKYCAIDRVESRG